MTEPQTPTVPTFGRRTTPITYRPFDLEYRMAANPDDVRTEHFEVSADLDGGSLFAVMSAQTEAQQMIATARLMGQSLRDDDGISANYVQPVVPMTWEEYEEHTGTAHIDDEEHLDPDAERRAELSPLTISALRTIAEGLGITVGTRPTKPTLIGEIIAREAEQGEPLDEDSDDDGFARDDDGLLYYLGPDGPTTDTASLLVRHSQGSSRRRLAELMDHPRYIVEASALTEISRWLVREQANRPTRKPRPSQTGPRRTGRGSRGR